MVPWLPRSPRETPKFNVDSRLCLSFEASRAVMFMKRLTWAGRETAPAERCNIQADHCCTTPRRCRYLVAFGVLWGHSRTGGSPGNFLPEEVPRKAHFQLSNRPLWHGAASRCQSARFWAWECSDPHTPPAPP